MHVTKVSQHAIHMCCAIVSCLLYGLYRLASATSKLFRTAKFFRRVIIAGFVWNKQSSTASVGSAFFCRLRPTSAFRRKVPVPIFRLCRPGLTRSVAGHKNVDSVNEWNWRFLFPSWRSSRRVLFYAPLLHSSSDSVVRKNADWILDFMYEREREGKPLGASRSVWGCFFGSSVRSSET